jgi:hypothetical protein
MTITKNGRSLAFFLGRNRQTDDVWEIVGSAKNIDLLELVK